MKKLSDLITNSYIKYLKFNPHLLYQNWEQAKMKFGQKQVAANGLERMRIITRPNFHLKELQRALLPYIRNIELPECIIGGVKGCNNVLNASLHTQNRYFLTIDLKNFFKNLSCKRIYETFIDSGFDKQDAGIIMVMSTVNGNLPQGAPTSTAIANLVFASTAKRLQQFCNEQGITITVFVDDLTFSSKNDFQHLIPQIIEIIINGKFTVNQRKVHYSKGSCEITGLIVKNKKLKLPSEMRRHLHNPKIQAYATLVEWYNQKLSQRM